MLDGVDVCDLRRHVAVAFEQFAVLFESSRWMFTPLQERAGCRGNEQGLSRVEISYMRFFDDGATRRTGRRGFDVD